MPGGPSMKASHSRPFPSSSFLHAPIPTIAPCDDLNEEEEDDKEEDGELDDGAEEEEDEDEGEEGGGEGQEVARPCSFSDRHSFSSRPAPTRQLELADEEVEAEEEDAAEVEEEEAAVGSR